jgi:tetratricopeptide (TPR) repeat protein
VAESCDRAFGRYLRTLRERRRLTLDDVNSLSQTFPESISKGYLSRCENGHQKPAFSKVIALSRIYEVPADVLVERMELDLELDRVGGPDTEGLCFDDLVDAGRHALDDGQLWRGYAYFRDAAILAPTAPVRATFRDSLEQITVSQQNIGTTARALGRHRYALHEFRHAESTGALGPVFHALVLERLACCYRFLRDLPAAEDHAIRAVEEAEACGSAEYLGAVYSTRARVALSQSKIDLAIEFYQRAFETTRSSGREIECARALNNLAQCFYEQKRFGAARKAAKASLSVTSSRPRHRIRALSLILLGELLEKRSEAGAAETYWKRASTIAKELNDKELRFRAEFARYKRAVQFQEQAIARALHRRLVKLASWLPQETEILEEFKSFASSN